jgi:ATP-dependent protease ClpP protease subunit
MKKLMIVLIILLMACIGQARTPQRTLDLNWNNTIVLSDDIDGPSAQLLMLAMTEMLRANGINKPMYLVLNSPGGQIAVGAQITRFLMIFPNLEVICVKCLSAAAAIFQQAPGKRLIVQNSVFMAHHCYRLANANYLMSLTPSMIKMIKLQSDKFDATIYGPMKMSKAAYEEKIDGKDWYLRGKEILKHNGADEIVKVRCDEFIEDTRLFDCV